jgi:LL-diaminopimelate aminotransferase
MKREAIAQGKDVIDLGVGDPDIPTPQPIIDACTKALQDPVNHRYPYQMGSMKYRESIVRFFKNRYGVSLDAVKNIIPLIGSKEGLAHFPLVFVNPGDVVLAPDPGYPAYITGTVLAGGEYYPLPLLKKNNYLMEFESIPSEIMQKAKLFFFNYPNNPTTGSADLNYFKRIASFCHLHKIIAAHDAAYQELYFESAPPSFLQAPLAMETGIEFHSLSKTFSMTGWRVGFAAGEASLIAGLNRIKTNIDTGLFLAIQEAAAFALDHLEELTQPAIAIYKRRRDIVIDGLHKAGFMADIPDATIYVWAEVPKGIPSMDFAKRLLEAKGVVVTPGSGLGKASEGFFRISLTTSEDRLQEAIRRMHDFSKDI